jgi:hypothetical protein
MQHWILWFQKNYISDTVIVTEKMPQKESTLVSLKTKEKQYLFYAVPEPQWRWCRTRQIGGGTESPQLPADYSWAVFLILIATSFAGTADLLFKYVGITWGSFWKDGVRGPRTGDQRKLHRILLILTGRCHYVESCHDFLRNKLEV